MKLASIIIIAVLTLAVGQRAAPAQEAKDPWPKSFQHEKGTVIMYQPQLEDMKDNQLTAYAALSFQKKDWKQPVFGAVWLTARVVTDRDERMATIDRSLTSSSRTPSRSNWKQVSSS